MSATAESSFRPSSAPRGWRIPNLPKIRNSWYRASGYPLCKALLWYSPLNSQGVACPFSGLSAPSALSAYISAISGSPPHRSLANPFHSLDKAEQLCYNILGLRRRAALKRSSPDVIQYTCTSSLPPHADLALPLSPHRVLGPSRPLSHQHFIVYFSYPR